MGQEIVLKKIKSKGVVLLVMGIVLIVVGTLLALIMIISKSEIFAVVFFALLAAAGVLILIMGVKNLLHPEDSAFIKNNPDLLEQANQLYSNIVYQDDFVVISDKVIANKKAPLQMAYLEDVYLVYRHTSSMNGIHTANEIVLQTKNKKNTLRLSVYAKGKQTRGDLFELLAKYCPNAYFGWTQEGLARLAQLREAANASK